MKQLDVMLGEGALDCTIGGLAATAHAAADPVRSVTLSNAVMWRVKTAYQAANYTFM